MSKNKVYIRDLIVAYSVVIMLSLATVLSGHENSIAKVTFIILGPISGWILAISDNAIIDAIWMLLLTTILTLLAILKYLKTQNKLYLCLSAILWYCFGYLFTIAIWI